MQKTFQGGWRFSGGYLIWGTVRVARLDCDTNPSDEFIAAMFDWVCDRLNGLSCESLEEAIEEASIGRLPHIIDLAIKMAVQKGAFNEGKLLSFCEGAERRAIGPHGGVS